MFRIGVLVHVCVNAHVVIYTKKVGSQVVQIGLD